MLSFSFSVACYFRSSFQSNTSVCEHCLKNCLRSELGMRICKQREERRCGEPPLPGFLYWSLLLALDGLVMITSPLDPTVLPKQARPAGHRVTPTRVWASDAKWSFWTSESYLYLAWKDHQITITSPFPMYFFHPCTRRTLRKALHQAYWGPEKVQNICLVVLICCSVRSFPRSKQTIGRSRGTNNTPSARLVSTYT